MAKFDIILKGTGEEDSKRPSRMQQSLNSELILSKEQLYDMFQQILLVKKFEHQILYNALMVNSRFYDNPNNQVININISVRLCRRTSSGYKTGIRRKNATRRRNGKKSQTYAEICTQRNGVPLRRGT